MPMTVLICGSPASGFQIIGLFPNSADAQSYAEDYSLKDWWVAEAFAEASKSHLRLTSKIAYRSSFHSVVRHLGSSVNSPSSNPASTARIPARNERSARLDDDEEVAAGLKHGLGEIDEEYRPCA